MPTALTALCLVPVLAAPSTDGAPPQLTAQDLGFGTTAPTAFPPSNHLGLVPGNTVRFSVAGGPEAAGGVAVLGASTGLAATPVPLGDGLLLIDPAGLQILALGPVDGAGDASFDLALPAGLPLGAPLATQAVAIDPALDLRTTNALVHEVTDLSPQVLDDFKKSGHPSAGTQTALVISDPIAWQSFWAQHLHPSVTPPPVDFARHVAIVGFGGHFLTFGYSVQIDQLVPLPGGGLQVEQTVLTPGPGCGSLFSESDPGQIVVVDRVAGGAPVMAVTQSVQGSPCP